MKYPRPRFVLVLLLMCGSSAATSPTALASEVAHAQQGMVVSDSDLASRAGVEVLRAGGNAVDAAVATALALAVTHPSAGNLGGGGFLLYRKADGKADAYDFREMAPASAKPEMFLRDGKYDAELHHNSHLAVGVPGTVAGLYLAWQEHGRLPWKRLVEPAIRLAQRGFPVSDALAASLKRALAKFTNSPAALAQFTRHGQPYQPGEILQQHELANTLRLIARRGPNGFYRGPVAERIEKEMLVHGGLITRADLAAYQAKRREPVRGSYRGYDILSMPPPSSGGVVLILMLNILEGYDLATNGFGCAASVHLMAEAMRRGFADRARYLGDPDANPNMPVNRLISKPYADSLRRGIRLDHASHSFPDVFDWTSPNAGQADGNNRRDREIAWANDYESPETTHLSVVDAQCNAVALTFTLEDSYGCGVIAPGTGFLLNNEMGDFNAGPGLTATNGLIGTLPNLAAPHKRMLSSMTPTIVTKDGQLFLVVGSPGGRTIINTVLEVLINVIEYRMHLPEAVMAPRFHHQWLPDEIVFEPHGLSPDTVALLRQRGHAVTESKSVQGDVAAIAVSLEGNAMVGVADCRAQDASARGPLKQHASRPNDR